MGEAIIQRSFAAGEITPSLAARADLATYQTGLRTCRNFLVRRQGGVANRPGTQLSAETKHSGDGLAFLYPFHFAAAQQSVVIEAGDFYFRFHRDGAPITVGSAAAWDAGAAYAVGALVEAGGVIYYARQTSSGIDPLDTAHWYALRDAVYEIPTPYPLGVWMDPSRANWSQQGFVLTITHVGMPVHELIYGGPTAWVLQPVVFGPSVEAPTNLAAAVGVPGIRAFHYVVTAARRETYEESNPSEVVEIVLADDPTPEAPHLITWDPVPDAIEYYVYSDGGFGNNTFGFLGTATDQAGFRDTGFVADFAVTPPIPRELFDGAFTWPAINTVYQQRRIFAGSSNDPDAVWTSQTGYVNNFAIRSPLQDDDAITFRIAAEQVQVAVHLLNVRPLVLLTGRGAWVIEGDEAGVLRPTSINPRQHAWTGCAFVRPAVIGDSIVFLQSRGTVMRDLRFDQAAAGFRGRDLSLVAAHLFTGYTITRMDYAEVPDSTVWAVRSDGVLLGLTYLPEEELWGWHRHDTLEGAFEDVCVISEGNEDRVYVVVRREVDGETRRYVERFASRQYVALEDAFHVDGGVLVTADATQRVTGLAHLNGRQVVVVAGGAKRGVVRVTDGAVALPAGIAPGTRVAVGLPITARLETLTLDAPGTTLRDLRQNVTSVAFLLEASVRNFQVGPSFDKLHAVRPEVWDTATVMDGRVEITITGQFTSNGHVALEHTEPTPLTVLATLPNLTVGG